MKQYIKALFRLGVIDNRHYTNKKVSATLYAFQFLPAILVGLFGAIAVHPFFWVILLVVVILGIIDYVLFDALLDKITWKLLWSRFYKDESSPMTRDQEFMKGFEQNPNAENFEALHGHLKKK